MIEQSVGLGRGGTRYYSTQEGLRPADAKASAEAAADAATPAMGAPAVVVVAATFVTFHIAAYTEGLATSRKGALEGLFACMRVAVDAQRAGTRKGLVACWADVPVLALRVGCCR